jgi:hypothetical protein
VPHYADLEREDVVVERKGAENTAGATSSAGQPMLPPLTRDMLPPLTRDKLVAVDVEQARQQ